jgi:hypothetical protein
MQFTSLLLGSLFSSNALGLAVRDSPACIPGTASCEKSVCNSGNALGAMQDPKNSISASLFCSTYILSTLLVSSTATIIVPTTVETDTPVVTLTSLVTS